MQKEEHFISALPQSHALLFICETHQFLAENSLIHQLQVICDLWFEFHLIQNLCLKVDARRNLDQGNTFRAKFEYAALCDIQNRLFYFVCIVA